MKKKTPGAAKVNRSRRSLTPKSDAGPPPRIRRLKAAFATRPPVHVAAEDTMGPMTGMEDRHMRRLLQGILLEIRSTRQYVMWLHEMLANHELGKDADMPSRDTLQSKMKRKVRQDPEVKAMLAERAQNGLGEELTEEEAARIAAGEDVEQVLGI